MSLPAPRDETPATTSSGGDLARDAAQILAAMRAQLEVAESLEEVKTLVDRAEVVRVAARKARVSRQVQVDAAEYKLDAQRKAGAMLAELERSSGGRPAKTPDTRSGVSEYQAALRDAELNERAARRWQQLAALPEETFEEYKAEAREKADDGPTTAGAVKQAKHLQRVEETRARDKTRQEERATPGAATVTQLPCLEWLPAAPEADLLLTDPPYSTDVDDVHAFAHEWLPAALACVKPTGRAYVCIGAYPDELLAYLSAPRSGMTLADVLVWTYRNTIGPSSKVDYSLNWQAILHYRGPDAPPLRTTSLTEKFAVIDMNAPDGRRGERWHTWQKPDELGERLVEHATEPGATVIDPFAGTGTFLLAAARLGRTAHGADRDPDMVAIAKERGCE